LRHPLFPAFVLSLFATTALANPASYVSPVTRLQDDNVFTINADGTYTQDETVAVRINTAEAVANRAQTDLVYSPSHETMQVLEAYTQTPDGKKLPVSPDRIIDQQTPQSTGAPMYSDDKVKAIIFPGIVPGAVKHYHYIRTVKVARLPGVFSMGEIFDNDVSWKESTVALDAPASLNLTIENDGLTGGDVAASPGRKKYVYTLADAPAFPPEMGSVSIVDSSPRLAATSLANPAALGAAYMARAADKVQPTSATRALAAKITQGITDPRAKATALYDWVSKNIRYVAIGLGDGGWVPRPADTIIATGYGDCKDHVTVLQALLASENISSSGFLVNLGNSYWAPRISTPAYNHIITYIPQFNLFVDSTAQFAPFGVLPPSEEGKTGLIVGAPGVPSRLVTLPMSTGAMKDVTRITIDADGTANGVSVVHDSGVNDFIARAVFAHIQPGTESQVAASAMSQANEMGSGTITGTDPRDLTTPFVYQAPFTLPGIATFPGHGALVVPQGVPAIGAIRWLSQDDALPVRTRAIVCLPNNKTETSFMTFPAGTDIKYLPPDISFSDAVGSYTSTYTRTGLTVQAVRHLVLHASEPVCGPADYQNLRKLASAVNRDLAGTIVY
jgi:hypothetical protein